MAASAAAAGSGGFVGRVLAQTVDLVSDRRVRRPWTSRQAMLAVVVTSAVILAWALGRNDRPTVAAVAVLALAALALLGLPWWLAHRVWRRLWRAVRAEDVAAAWRCLERLRDFYHSAPSLAMLRYLEAGLFSMELRFDESRRLLESIDAALLNPAYAVQRDNSLAWCLAHTGEPKRAAELAQTTLLRAGARLRPYCHGTLGAALSLGGKPREALEELDVAIKTGHADPRAQVIRWFYRGEALRALGRLDEAMLAYQQACRYGVAPRWAERARERMATTAGADPYRSG
jgi:tetratricopeptide (TPR) repeat protein